MPIVIGYNDPSLVATLASQASRYKVGQQSFEDNLQSQANDRQNLALQTELLRERDPQPQQQPDAAAQGTQQVGGGGYTEILPNRNNGGTPFMDPATGQMVGGDGGGPGARIYHPPGDVPPQMAGGGGGAGGYYNQRAGGGMGGYPGIMPGGGYLTPLQQQQHTQIDQMLQAGYLQPDEATRWKMMVTAGKDPFSQQTIAEQSKLRQITHPPELDQMRDQQLSMREQALKDAEGRGDQRSDQNAYERQRNALKDAIEAKQKQLASVPITDSSGVAKSLTDDIHGLTDKLLDLPNSYVKNAGGSAGGGSSSTDTKPGNVNPGATPASRPKAGGTISITQSKSLSPDVVDDFVRQANGDPAKAKQLAIAAGYAVQ